MSQPATLTLDLENFSDASEGPHALTLDLWKGLSASIRVIVSNQSSGPDVYNEALCYCSPFAVSDDSLDHNSSTGAGVHFARALNEGFLVIKDVHGDVVYFDDTANDDLWSYYAAWLHRPPQDCNFHYLVSIGQSLLRQFRNRLDIGSDYILQLGQKFCTLDFEQHFAGDSSRRLCLKQEVQCEPTRIPFSVLAGTPIPRFTMSFSITPSHYRISGGQGFALTHTCTSMAKAPVKLALVDSSYKENYFRELSIEWSFNGFPNMVAMGNNTRFPHTQSRIWKNEFNIDAPTHTDLIPGAYRHMLINQEQESKPTAARFLPSRIPQKGHRRRNPDALPLELSSVVLCPGDQLVQHYVVGQNYLEKLEPNKKYYVRLKTHRCQYWKYVSDFEVATDASTNTSVPDWPDHGPIWFEHVSEVAVTLERFLESARPMPLFKLPYELRREIYRYLRFRNAASVACFKTMD